MCILECTEYVLIPKYGLIANTPSANVNMYSFFNRAFYAVFQMYLHDVAGRSKSLL